MLPPYTINFPSSLNSSYWLETLSRTRGYGVCPMFSFPCGLFPVISGLFQFPGWYPQLYILVSICLFRDYSISVNLFLVHQKHPCQEPLFTEKVYERSLLYMNIVWLHIFTYGNTFDLEDFFLPSHPFLLWSPVRPGARKQPRLPKNTHHWDIYFFLLIFFPQMLSLVMDYRMPDTVLRTLHVLSLIPIVVLGSRNQIWNNSAEKKTKAERR